jgi:hypothetical protein
MLLVHYEHLKIQMFLYTYTSICILPTNTEVWCIKSKSINVSGSGTTYNCDMSRIAHSFRQSVHRCGWGWQPFKLALLYLQKDFWINFCQCHIQDMKRNLPTRPYKQRTTSSAIICQVPQVAPQQKDLPDANKVTKWKQLGMTCTKMHWLLDESQNSKQAT